jgi:hypothetical protein
MSGASGQAHHAAYAFLNEQERLVIDMDGRCLASPDKDCPVRIAHESPTILQVT